MTAEHESLFSVGQVWRSKALRDYQVELIRRFDNGWWLVKPRGSSAHGNYTQHEDVLANPNLYEKVSDGERGAPLMAAWDDRGTWRTRNTAAAESKATDLHPACPRCGDLLAPGSRYCVECGCAVTVERSVGTVDEPDEAA